MIKINDWLRDFYNYNIKSISDNYPSYKIQLKPYLYLVEYDYLDYYNALEYFKNQKIQPPSACSALRKDALYGRNYDWFYNNSVEFLVKTSRNIGHYKTIGIAGGFSKLTKAFVDDEKNDMDDIYKVLPFQLVDGINEYGLIANYNVVPNDYENNIIIPTEEQEVELNALMLVRFILDKFKSAATAVNYIQKHCKIYFPTKLHEMNYELHVMIADSEKTFCLEFIDNQTKILDISDKPYMTNFHLYGVEFTNGRVYTPATQTSTKNAMDTNHITKYGSGLERFNMIVENYEDLSSLQHVKNLMTNLYYTRAYQSSASPSDPIWYTEFVGDDLTVKSQASDFADIIEISSQKYIERSRSTGLTWCTYHSAIYDMNTLTLYVASQEDQNFISFRI